MSGAKINISANKDKGTANQKTVVIKGNPLQIKIASDMIDKCVSFETKLYQSIYVLISINLSYIISTDI